MLITANNIKLYMKIYSGNFWQIGKTSMCYTSWPCQNSHTCFQGQTLTTKADSLKHKLPEVIHPLW